MIRRRLTAAGMLLLLCFPFGYAQTPPNLSVDILPATEGYGFGWWTPLASAPSLLHWRFGVDLGDFPTNLEAALGQAASIKVANYVGSGGQRVSLQIARPLAPGLYPGELRTVARLSDSFAAYRLPSLPTQETAARQLFEFAKAIKIETLILENPPGDMALANKLAQEFGVNVAFCGAYQTLLNALSHAGPKVGACLNTARLAQEKIATERMAADLKDRILIVELQEGFADTAAFLQVLYRRGVKPSLFVMRAGSPANSPVPALKRVVADLDSALRPLIADRAAQLSRRSDQGQGTETPEERAARAAYTEGNSTSWDPVTPDRQAAIEAALPQQFIVKPKKPRKLLVIDLNLAYPGHRSIPTHNYGLRRLGLKTGAYEAVFDNNLDNLKYPAIKRFDAIFLNNTVGLLFEDPQVRAGLLRYVREGGGLGGNHASSHASMDWPEFAEMLGAFPSAHLEPTEKAWLKLDDPHSPLNAGFGGKEFLYQDEYFRFTDPPYSRDKLHILLSIDVEKTDMAQMELPGGPGKINLGREDSDYAVSWIREYGRGRVFYTVLGHNPTMFSTPEIASHMLGGLQFILGDLQADTTPSARGDPKPREVYFSDASIPVRKLTDSEVLHRIQEREEARNIQFERACAICHGRIETAPTVEYLRSLTPEKIYEALTVGKMKDVVPDRLTDLDKRNLAEFLTGRPVGGADPIDRMEHRCAKDLPAKRGAPGSAWSGWSPDSTNARFQKVSGLTPASVRRLKLKWAFAAPGASAMYGQPIFHEGRIYIGDDTNHFYALDAATGCVHWVFRGQSYSRGAPVMGQVAGKDVLFLGDVGGVGYAVDASSGQELWHKRLDPHLLARIAASPQFHEGRVYFPVGALEEIVAFQKTYKCCTTRGSVVALDAATGEQVWKTYSIATPAVLQEKLLQGKPYWGPAGANVWASPTIDPKRRRLYFVTGNLFTDPETGDEDAIHALDLDTGRRLWKRQTYKDIWGGVVSTGPDFDFSASPILSSAGGRDLLLAGQKSGDVWALNPDDGRVVWHRNINRGNTVAITTQRSEILFGGAADETTLYYGMGSGGIVAIDIATGEEKWMRSVPTLPPMVAGGPARRGGITAAVSLIPGVLFTGGVDGSLRAFATQDGAELWSFDTRAPVKTVNGVAAKGGTIGNPGPVIAQGMVFASSGYVGFQKGMGGNLLLAFAPE